MFGRRIANDSLLALAGSPLAGSALAQDADRDVELALGDAFTSMAVPGVSCSRRAGSAC